MSVGQRLVERRHELGLTRKDLVKLTGLSYPYVSQLENDDRTPTIATLEKLAQALELPVEALLSESAAVAAAPAGMFANPAYSGSAAPVVKARAAATPQRAAPQVDGTVDRVLSVLDEVPLEHRLAVLGDVTTHVVRDIAGQAAQGRSASR